MKKILPIVIIIILALALLLVACSSNADKYKGQVKVTFELEGGNYRNCTLPVLYYYDFEEGTSNLIAEPSTFSGLELERSGYILEGWYCKKNQDGTYSDKWDFATDKVESAELTLYANWVKALNHTYILCYKDELSGDDIELTTYSVDAGEKFSDIFNKANSRYGYTKLRFEDENGNLWDNDFTHPGGETSVAVKVYVKYIKGMFALVSTAEELKKATASNIYLLADIDMKGETLKFGNYKKTFEGNGYTISNFAIGYNAGKDNLVNDYFDDNYKSLGISLFGNMNGGIVRNVNFEGVTVNVATTLSTCHAIYLAPLACGMIGTSSLENVNAEITYTVGKLPTATYIDDGYLVVYDDSPYIVASVESKATNCQVSLTKQQGD